VTTFSAPDGSELSYVAFEPDFPKSAVLFLPGWSDHGGRWTHVGERLVHEGVATYLLDLRGHGRSAGPRGHLARFSQLLGDLQAFRRMVRQRTTVPQVLLGHSFGGLVVLRYLETQPSDVVAGAAVTSPYLGLTFQPPAWKLAAGRLLADLWPTLAIPTGLRGEDLVRDPVAASQYDTDPLVHHRMTTGAWREIQWAQRAVAADARRIECPLLLLLAGEDRIVDAARARDFAGSLTAEVDVRWYPEMYHELLLDPQRARVLDDITTYLRDRDLA